MKSILHFSFCTVLALAPVVHADSDDEAAAKPAAVKIARNANGETVLTLDRATQQRLGLVAENPARGEWQPEIRASGRVADPLAFTAAAADYEAARAAAAASDAELARTKTLAAQQNAAPRAVEAAQAAAARDSLAVQSARAKFTMDWGMHLAAGTNLSAYAGELQTNSLALIKILLPGGTFPSPLPATARITVLNRTNSFNAEFADDLGVDPATQTEALLFSAKQKLPPGIAVAARLKIPGETAAGVTVPASAILRHENEGWVFLQTGATAFTRRGISLDCPVDGGFFSAGISPTNRVVITGAQTLLSAELSGGNFNSGSRD
jgi:hypothetical protein